MSKCLRRFGAGIAQLRTGSMGKYATGYGELRRPPGCPAERRRQTAVAFSVFRMRYRISSVDLQQRMCPAEQAANSVTSGAGQTGPMLRVESMSEAIPEGVFGRPACPAREAGSGCVQTFAALCYLRLIRQHVRLRHFGLICPSLADDRIIHMVRHDSVPSDDDIAVQRSVPGSETSHSR